MVQCKDLQLSCFIERGRKLVRVKKEITKLCNKLSMKVNLLVEFNRKNITLTANLIFTKLKL